MREYDFIKSPCVIDSKTLGSGVEVTFYRQPKKITALTLAGVYAGDVVAPDQFASAIGDMLVEFSESIVSHNFIGFYFGLEIQQYLNVWRFTFQN